MVSAHTINNHSILRPITSFSIDNQRMKKAILFFLTFVFIARESVIAQRFLADVDSSFYIKDTVRPVIKRFANLRITGYIQPQFQVASAKGIESYEGGNFSAHSQSRFMLRRARVKIEYALPSKSSGNPAAFFAFQVDGTERGVAIRDMFLKLFETKKNMFSLTAGLFGRPFGYEVNLSSAYREMPERGRMSQILLPRERDIGAMVSFEPRNKKNKLSNFKFDLGLFNGQGLTGTTDFDSRKDLVGRIYLKSYEVNDLSISGGLSFLNGGWKNGTKYVYKNGVGQNGDAIFIVDSTQANIDEIAPRRYYGADIQLKQEHKWGATEFRAEYWFGTQPGTSSTSTSPGVLPVANGNPLPTYIRHFNGAFFYFLQNIVNEKHQLLLKYDWYDPNVKVKKQQIGKPGTNLTPADIKFATTGIGYIYSLNKQTRLILSYSMVSNENTALPGFTSQLNDNVFTCRLHFIF